jgi:hypothetical protein
MRTIPDKQGRPINVNERPSGWKITPLERDTIYQEFLQAFPDAHERQGILKEFLDERIHHRALAWFKVQEGRWPITADRIYHFISEAVATEAGVLPKSERWDWWVGCSLHS